MSTYQYYEFQAIDRPLTEEEQQAVSNLSSRVEPHPRRSVFVYHYSDLRADPKELLAKYYDAMFYIANWGATRLMFRFPKGLIDVKQIEPYCVEYYVTYETVGDYVILDLCWDEEEGYYEWVEGEGYLDGLITLRDDILQQDHRTLYLAWLSALSTWEITADMIEPPVPPGLHELTAPLERFIEVFHIDEALVNVAAMASPGRKETTSLPELRQRIAALPRDVCDDWLLRLVRGEEMHLSLLFRRYLLSGQETGWLAKGQRTVAELLALAGEEKERLRRQAAAEAEANRIRELETLAPKAEGMWIFVEQLLEQGYGNYDEAVELLVKLHDLALYQGTEEVYEARLQEIRNAYPRRKALLQRLDKAGLP